MKDEKSKMISVYAKAYTLLFIIHNTHHNKLDIYHKSKKIKKYYYSLLDFGKNCDIIIAV